MSRSIVVIILAATVSLICLEWTQATESLVIKAMKAELERSFAKLKQAGEAPLYFLAYRIYEGRWLSIEAEDGALKNCKWQDYWSMLHVEARVGSSRLDNTHVLRLRSREAEDPPHIYESSEDTEAILSLENEKAIRQALWLKTDEAYKKAQERYKQVNANKEVLVEEDDLAADFSQAKPQVSIGKDIALFVDVPAWEARVKALSRIFLKYPFITSSSVSFVAEPTTRYLVTSEGTAIKDQITNCRVMAWVRTLTDDGMDLWLWDEVRAKDPQYLLAGAQLEKKIERIARGLLQLRKAPLAEPYVGPALLSGRAAAVFFHEVLGHRLEGHRQKKDSEGRTFAKKIATRIMPPFITIVDDPTVGECAGNELQGSYQFDDEGVPAQKVTVVCKGMLNGFLLSRSPVKGFSASNGHGRSAPGWNPCARQGNLIVTADQRKQLPAEGLRLLLIKEAKRQHKAYGLYFEEVAGGSTMTAVQAAQVFSLFPLKVYKVYVDGRPDELIRGADIVGTPLSSLEKILAVGKDYQTFNGVCGAESGKVPVSATAPSMLVRSIEIQRTSKSSARLPILPDPDTDSNPAIK